MSELAVSSKIILYILLALIGILALVVWWWQIQVFQGKEMDNPDGSADSWHQQKIFFGIAAADIFIACPTSILGIALVFLSPRWGIYLLTLVSFWFLWANVMTTVTSLRFEKPRITLNWLIVFPFGAVVGLAFIVWTVINFDAIYLL